jgi:hypothetical protein
VGVVKQSFFFIKTPPHKGTTKVLIAQVVH